MDDKYSFNTPLSPIRFQSQLGKELKRLYKEGNNVVRLSLARVTKVNYKYNTVEVITTLHKNSTTKNPNDNGRYSARLPITFGGRTPNGKVYGTNTLVTVGSLVLIGFLEGRKDNPIVLNIYGEPDNQSLLTRTSLTSADESDEAIQRELWQLFSLYPSMTYRNIDGRGNQEITFSGKSFVYTTDTDQDNAYVNDSGFDYDHLPSSRYANGELIEPVSPNAPTVLYVHQAIYGDHRVTFFIKSDGTVRLASRHTTGQGITFQELKTDGTFSIVQKKDTTDPEEDSKVFSKIEISQNGNIVLQTPAHKLEITPSGLLYDGKPLSSANGGDGTVIGDIQKQLEQVQSSITIMDDKIESKVSKTTYNADLESVREYAKGLTDAVQADVDAVNQGLNDLNTYIDGAFKDGVITDAESKTIAAYVHTLDNDKASMDAKYTEIYTNSYLDDTNKTALTNAKEDYDNKYESLINTINIATADNTISSEEKEAVDSAFSDYRASLSVLDATLDSAINAIASAKAEEALENAKTYVDGEITQVNSTITQLAEEIDLKVDSTTFTNQIQNLEATMATKEETQALDNRLTAAEQEINNAVALYRIVITSTNGLVFENGNVSSTIIATVYQGNTDITNTLPASSFIWTRISNDAEGDAAWNQAHANVGRSFTITAADVPLNATFKCDIDIPD
ncbi:coiled-coil domain-containing protein [Collinsella aerofaciens]|uniref:coiled-coil domain-containing protein n=1 Tax=Collinsella aerofaciens TaxID=74426 RepID=UPI001D02BC3A|nr:hypothetical protein [Collinsella aerofaciens]MCB5366913.1 hypothetical protein [Collinsella aerofaciens]MCB5368962.1 hypothetical protein [Collinsella aerofaciens]